MNDFILETNRLSIRPGETFAIQRQRPLNVKSFERVYIVAKLETPPFPFAELQGVHNECRMQTVIVAEVYPTIKSEMAWRIGWVHVEQDTKANIGFALESENAISGEWFFLILDTRKHRLSKRDSEEE